MGDDHTDPWADMTETEAPKRRGRPPKPKRRIVSVRLTEPLMVPHRAGADPQRYEAGPDQIIRVVGSRVEIKRGSRVYDVPMAIAAIEWEEKKGEWEEEPGPA